MKAIITAAGLGSRLRPLTNNLPKCMLLIHGQTVLDRMVSQLNEVGVSDITVVVGYLSDSVKCPGIKVVVNSDFESNNILHSLFYARSAIEHAANSGQSLLTLYADILFDSSVLKQLLSVKNESACIVDINWRNSPQRTNVKDLAQAEKVQMDRQGIMLAVGKQIETSKAHGEFIGLCKFEPHCIRQIIVTFDRMAIEADSSQGESAWKKAYLTNLLDRIVKHGFPIHCDTITSKWWELDTISDYELAAKSTDTWNGVIRKSS